MLHQIVSYTLFSALVPRQFSPQIRERIHPGPQRRIKVLGERRWACCRIVYWRKISSVLNDSSHALTYLVC